MNTNATNKRQLAAVLFADIVGYTALMQKDEASARQMLDKFHFAINTKVESHQGRVVNNYGDGCVCTFDSAVSAMLCAKELQLEFQSLPKVPVRIGLHSGDVFFQKDNVYGDSVNIASRIESLGVPGAVLFSNQIRRHIANQSEFKVELIGEFDFKNVDKPLEVFALANEGFIVPKKEDLKGKLKLPIGEQGGSFFQRIWKKRIPQILVAYILIAWLGVQLFDWALYQFGISPHWAQIFFITAVGIIPSLLLYLNNRERIHKKHFTKKEKILFPTNLIILGAVLFFMFRTTDLGATSKNITFVNADGQEETRNVIKEAFRIHVPIYPFQQITDDSVYAWIGLGISTSLGFDLGQDKYIDTHPSTKSNLSTVDKINDAKIYDGDFYIDGTYQFSEGYYLVTPTLRNRRNGNIVNERTFKGNDPLSLVDSVSLHLRKAIGLSPSQIEESIDLDYKEWTTDNFEAAKETTLYFKNNRRKHLERAIELDSTYVGACLLLAMNYHVNSRGKFEAKRIIDQAMRHRRKLPFQLQIMTMVNHHLIHEEWEKAEKLLKMQLEIAPNDVEFNGLLLAVYWQTGQVDEIIELAEKNFSQNPKPSTGFFAMQAALMKGEPDKVIRITKGFLLLDQQNTFILNLLVHAYIHKKDFDAAKETIEKIILIDPDAEKSYSLLLAAIDFMKSHPDYSKTLSKYEGTYRNTYGAQLTNNHILNGQIYGRPDNQFGKFLYPAGENTFVTGSPSFAYRKKYLLNDQGEVYATINTNIRRKSESDFFTWKQDSLIWNAEKLLMEKDYQKALAAYELAIEKHPEHFYLHLAKRHLEFVTSTSKEDLLKIYQRHVGKYGKVSITLENDQLMWKQIGFGREYLFPISEHEFISTQAYAYIFAFELKNGEVDAFQEYKYNLESETWEKQEEWYFKKERLLD